MNITLTVVSRATLDQPFTQLVPPSVLTLSGETLGYTPVLPSSSDALELRLRVAPAADTVNVDVGDWLDPANPPAPTPIFDSNGTQIGVTPAPMPTVDGRYGVWGGASRDIPFGAHQSFRLRKPGVVA